MPFPRLSNSTQRKSALPSKPPKTHLGLQSSPGVCSKPNHAQRLLDKEGHAGASSQSGRESALVVDQGPVVSSPSGADCRDRSHLDGGHRARCGEEDQCVQEEDRSTGSLDPVRGGVHKLPNHGCLEEQDLPPPHGAGSDAQWQGEHGVRQTLRDDLRAGCGGEAGVHQVVREHSGGEPRELLAPTSLRAVGTGDVKDREGGHPSSLGQSVDGRLSSQDSDAKASCGAQRSVRFRENSWELAQEMSHDLEMVPDQAMNRIKELEEELIRLRQEMTNRENLNHKTPESKQSKGPSPP